MSLSQLAVPIVLAAVLLVLVLARRSVGTGAGQRQKTEQYISDDNSVGFDIDRVSDFRPGIAWRATYKSDGKIARFRVEFGVSQPRPDDAPKEVSVRSGKGRLVAEPGSDSSALLRDLAKALEAKTIPKEVKRVPAIPFVFVSLGDHQSQAEGGGFFAEPPGNWTPNKLFLGDEQHDCEVFLNINPVIKKGQFSIKDEDYGDCVIVELAKVL